VLVDLVLLLVASLLMLLELPRLLIPAKDFEEFS
jgi:competence protein ComGC